MFLCYWPCKIYGIREEIPVKKIKQEMAVMVINDALKLGRLRWFAHMKRREDGNWANR